MRWEPVALAVGLLLIGASLVTTPRPEKARVLVAERGRDPRHCQIADGSVAPPVRTPSRGP